MCRRNARWLTAALAAVLVVPAAVNGQQKDARAEEEAQLLSRVKAMEPQLDAATRDFKEAKLRKAAERERANGRLDTLMVGPLRVLVFPGQEEVARDVVGSVWRRDFAGWVERSPTLATWAFFFQWTADPKPFRVPHEGVTAITAPLTDSRRQVNQAVRTSIGLAIERDLHGSALATWASLVANPAPGVWLYRQMVTAPSVAVRSCLAGSIQACVSAAGLVEDDYPLDDWYTPAERLELAVRERYRWGAAETEACSNGDIEACDAALKGQLTTHDYRWAIPLSPALRGSLVWFALHQGGQGAWDRLIDASDTSVAAALTHASGMPVNDLVAKWRAWILTQRPAADAGIGMTGGVTLFWIILLSTLAMRSTRWRLG